MFEIHPCGFFYGQDQEVSLAPYVSEIEVMSATPRPRPTRALDGSITRFEHMVDHSLARRKQSLGGRG
jgi:hypothetical protein